MTSPNNFWKMSWPFLEVDLASKLFQLPIICKTPHLLSITIYNCRNWIEIFLNKEVSFFRLLLISLKSCFKDSDLWACYSVSERFDGMLTLKVRALLRIPGRMTDLIVSFYSYWIEWRSKADYATPPYSLCSQGDYLFWWSNYLIGS